MMLMLMPMLVTQIIIMNYLKHFPSHIYKVNFKLFGKILFNTGVNVKKIIPNFCYILLCWLNTCNETFCIVFRPLLLSSLRLEEAKTALIAEETVKGSILLH